MFYSQFLLSRKGPLGVIWTAAHLESKLKRKHIADTDIAESVDQILHSDVPIALRISSHLLVGVVKIYARKVDYLFHDCSEALLKIRHAFETSAINLPPTALVASYHAVTLPESFDFDELGIYVNLEDAAYSGTWVDLEQHVTARDLITLQEPVDEPNPYTMPGLSFEQFVPGTEAVPVKKPVNHLPVYEDILPPLPMEEDMELDYVETERVFEGQQFNKAPKSVESVEILRAHTKVTEQEYLAEIKKENIQKEGPQQPEICVETLEGSDLLRAMEVPVEMEILSPLRTVEIPLVGTVTTPELDILGSILGGGMPVVAGPSPTSKTPRKRKRKPVFDTSTTITSLSMRKQLAGTGDICRQRWKVPSVKYQIWISQINNPLEQRMVSPTLPDMSDELKVFFNHIISCKPEPVEFVPDIMRDQQIPTDVYSDVEETIEITCGHIEEIGGRSSVKRRIEFGAIQPVQPRNAFLEAVKTHITTDRGEFVMEIENSRSEEATTLIQPSDSPLREIEAVGISAMAAEPTVIESEISDKQYEDLSGKAGLAVLLQSQETAAPDRGLHELVEIETDLIGKIVHDKTGWPSRTRAVAGFLKEKFHAGGTEVLYLGELLQGRRRKESARMFFETLVLTSTGYLRVEQRSSYCDIYLLPTNLLMTTDF